MDYSVKSIHDITGPVKTSGSQLCYQICPVCKDARWKFYINPDTGKWFCFSGAHYAGGTMDTTPEEGEESYTERILRVLQPVVHSLDEIADIMLPPFKQLSNEAWDYLLGRNLEEEQVINYGMVEQVDVPRIIIPYVNHGSIVYWTARAYKQTPGPKYVYPTGIDRRLFMTKGGNPAELCIVEGVFDALAVERAGYSAVALGGKTLTDKMHNHLIDAVDGAFYVYVMLDMDALSEALTLKDVLDYEIGGEVQIRPLTAKDPGSMTPDEIGKVIRNEMA